MRRVPLLLLCLGAATASAPRVSSASGEPLSPEAASEYAGGGLLTNIVRAMPHEAGAEKKPVRMVDQEDEDLFADARHVRGLRDGGDRVLRRAMAGCTTDTYSQTSTFMSASPLTVTSPPTETSLPTSASESTATAATGAESTTSSTESMTTESATTSSGSEPTAKVSKKTRKLQKKYVDLRVQEAEHTAHLRAEEEAFHAQRAAAEKRLADETRQIAAIRAELLAEAQQLRAMRVSEETRKAAEKRHQRELVAVRKRERAQARARAAARRAANEARRARIRHDREQKLRTKELAKLRKELSRRDALEAALRDERARMQAMLAQRMAGQPAGHQNDEAAQVMRELLGYLKTSQSAHPAKAKPEKKSRKRLFKKKRAKAAKKKQEHIVLPPPTVPQPAGQDAVCFPQTSPIVALYLQGVPQAPLLGGSSRTGAGTVCYRHADLRAAGIVV